MKLLICLACLMSCVLAEPPPSKGYLPPSARGGGGGGYPSGPSGFGAGPGVIAARSQPSGHRAGSTFARSGFGSQAGGAYGGSSRSGGYSNAGDDGFGSEPASYSFDYSVTDGAGGGAEFGHQEARREERAEGQYHVLLPDGRKQTVSYEADEGGFKPRVSYEEAGGGYDSNAQGFGRGGGGSHGYGAARSGAGGGYGAARSGTGNGYASGRSGGY